MTASSLPQQQSVEERLFSALTAAGYGQKISSSTTVELSAQEKLYAEQNQWLAKAEADLQGHAINVVPGIHIQQGALGTATGIINDLIPSEVWSLRSLSPSLRYCAYRMMTEEAREMIRYDQASEEFQRRWACIVNLRAFFMQKEKEWVESFQQIINTHRRAFWDQKVEVQAVETPVTQAMIDAFETSKMKARGLSPVGVTVENETLQTAPSEPAPSTKKAVQKHRSSTCKPDAASVASVKPPKPDTIKHPLDKVAVPKYPFDDISDFTPNEDGMYQCMHEFGRNWSCCISGLDEDRMKQAIYRSISTWKSQVERLIGRGYLHPSHMTWRTHQNQALRRNRIGAERKRAELQLRSEGREVAQSGKEEKKGQEQRSTAEDMTKASQGKKKRQGLQRRPREDDASRRSSSVPAPDSPQQHAIAPKALPNGVATRLTSDWDIARVNMRDKQEFEDCRRAEQQKKSPNWPRFEEWWAARLLQVQCLQLSKDQKMVLKRPEPSSIEDNDPVFVEKTKDLLPAHVQKSVDAKENVVSDDSDLDDLFNDDASSREET
ncbi:hypothetical protein ACET3X_004782 [Alternaria dauci]|uniref:Uncharacterized protein n=1 Tax=Alternaria dauci TaxID=48095 RepID=A0ABR3UJ18_9PLEO